MNKCVHTSIPRVTVVSSAPKASWVVMYAMDNHTYNPQSLRHVAINWESVTINLQSAVSCLGVKDTTQSLWEMLVGLLKKCCCHKKHCGCVGCTAV